MTAAEEAVHELEQEVGYQQILDDAGLTYRQLDHWTRRLYLRPVQQAQGTGSRRVWTEGERRVAVEMSSLIKDGFMVDVAADIARDVVAGMLSVDLADGRYRIEALAQIVAGAEPEEAADDGAESADRGVALVDEPHEGDQGAGGSDLSGS